MLKKILSLVFISCISASSYAYFIGSNLTVENKLNIPMLMTITMPDGSKRPVKIPAGETSKVDLSISGWELYKMYNAPFTIKSDDALKKLYAQGRIDYYIHAWPSQQYNFLDSISTAEGVSIDTTYSCYVADTTFENKIIINGTPNTAMEIKQYPQETHCLGLKSSIISDNHKKYTPTCMNGKTAIFSLTGETNQPDSTEYDYSADEHNYLRVFFASPWQDDATIKRNLDRVLNEYEKHYYYVNNFCGSW